MIEIKDRLIRVICTGGDHRLGGASGTKRSSCSSPTNFAPQTGETSDPMDDPEVLNDLFLQAERGKKTLSQREKAPFRVTHAGHQARIELDREIREITASLLDRTLALTREMLAAPRGAKGHESFDKIILVGGATRMPQVRGRLVAEFGKEPESFDPDEAVAKGAASFGLKESLQDEVNDFLNPNATSAIDLDDVSESELSQALDHLEKQLGFTLTGPVRDLVNTRIVNVLSKSLGVVAKNDDNQEIVVYLLPRNSEVPLERTTDFGTDAAHQTGVNIRVVAGERDSPEPSDCQDVGMATLNLPPNLPRRSPIRVTFSISREGRLTVAALDLTGGGSIDVTFEIEAVLNAAGRSTLGGVAVIDGVVIAPRSVSEVA